MIIKSLHSILLTNQLSYGGRHFHAVSVGWAFRLSTGMALTEQQFWAGAAALPEPWMDEAQAKARAEFLVAGQAYPPAGCNNFNQIPVSVRLGAVTKQMLVSGQRHWQGVMASIAEPFTSMPLGWNNSFGGPGHEANPMGKGAVDASPRPLPNIESPEQQMLGPGSKPAPVNLGPMPVEFPARRRLAGTFDERYLKNQPAFPDDINWEFFNVAQEDQRFSAYLHGDEEYELINLHPELPRIQGRLPNLTARAFVTQQVASADPADTEAEPVELFKEIPLRLDTVWFLPDQDMALILERGSCECADRLGRDIVHTLCAHEGRDHPRRTLDHYQDYQARRTDPTQGYKYMLYTSPLLPEGFQSRLKDMLPETPEPSNFMQGLKNFSRELKQQGEARGRQAEEDARQSLTENAPGGAEHSAAALAGLKPPEGEGSPLGKQLTAMMERMLPGVTEGKGAMDLDLTKLDMRVMDDMRDLMKQEGEQQKQDGIQQLRDQKHRLEMQPAETPGRDKAIAQIDELLEAMTQAPVLRRFEFPEQQQTLKSQLAQARDELQQLVDRGEAAQASVDRLKVDLAPYEEKLQKAKAFVQDAYGRTAHYQNPESRSPHSGQETELVTALVAAHVAGKDCRQRDVAFGQLENLDLGGMEAPSLFAEFTRISGSSFVDAVLDGAVFAHARIETSDFSGARLQGANLGAAHLQSLTFRNSDFSGATFSKSHLKDCVFEDCIFAERADQWLETRLEGVLFRRCRFLTLNFLELDLTGSRFLECEFESCHFIKCEMPDTAFDDSRFQKVNLVKCNLERASFTRVQGPNLRFLGGCNLQYSQFREAMLDKACLRQARLQNSDFSQATVREADLGDAQLQAANFTGARLNRSLLAFSGADQACFDRADLMETNLMGLSVKGARFREANLYASNMFDVTLSNTDFSGANLEGSLLQDWRPMT